MTPKKRVLELAASLGGIPVLASLPGSPAARAGIRYGDILLSVNGMPTRTWLDYLAAKELRGGAMDVVVFRSGQECVANLTFSNERASAASVLAEVAEMRMFGDGETEPVGPLS